MESRGRTRTSRSRVSDMSIAEKSALRNAQKSRDAALERLANEDPTTTSGDDNTVDSLEVGRRALTMDTPLRAVDASGLDLADDVFGDLDESFDLGDDLLKGQRSVDSSTLSLRNLGRQRSRSRQSSVIGRNDPPIRPSSRSGATPLMSSSFNIGAFRRRKREPSILGTNRKPRYDTTGSVAGSVTGSVAGSVASSAAGSVAGSVAGSDVGSDREISPEAESTPLNERRRSTRSRNISLRDNSIPRSSRSITRKRKSGQDMDTSDRPDKASRTEQAQDEAEDSDSSISSLGSPMALPPLLHSRPVTPTNEEDNAPPASSDSEEETAWPDIHALAKRRRRPSITTPAQLDQASDISSPPSLTHSPNIHATKRGQGRKKQPRSPIFTTADLASLLPKRRQRREDDHARAAERSDAVDTSGLAQDDDELQLDGRSSRRKRAARSKAGDKALQPRQTPAETGSATRRSARIGKTYSRRLSDKENENGDTDDDGDDAAETEHSAFVALPDDTFGEGAEERQRILETEELKAAAIKFKEVDRWELEYEEVAEPSSPQDAR